MIEPPIPANEELRLSELRALNILDTPAEVEYDGFVVLTTQLLNVPIATISFVDEDRQWFKAKIGMDTCQTDRSISFCGHDLDSRKPLIVEDALEDERFFDNPLVTNDPRIRFYVGMPLITRAGACVGRLCAIDTQPRKLEQKDLRVLEILSRQLVAIIEARSLANMACNHAHRLMQLNAALDGIRLHLPGSKDRAS